MQGALMLMRIMSRRLFIAVTFFLVILGVEAQTPDDDLPELQQLIKMLSKKNGLKSKKIFDIFTNGKSNKGGKGASLALCEPSELPSEPIVIPDDESEVRLFQEQSDNLWNVAQRSQRGFGPQGNPVNLQEVDLGVKIAENHDGPTLEVAPFGQDHYCESNCVYLNPMDMGKKKVNNPTKEIQVFRNKMLFEWEPADPQQKFNLIIGENLIISDKDIAKIAQLLAPGGKAYLTQVGLVITDHVLKVTSKIFQQHQLKITPIKHFNPKNELQLVGYQIEHL